MRELIVKIAGMGFRADGLKDIDFATAIISLVPDPDNQYDPNAIKIMADAHHIGYAPREQTGLIKIISRFISSIKIHELHLAGRYSTGSITVWHNKELDEGDECPQANCDGTLYWRKRHQDSCCSCHINPPCSYCADVDLTCDTCDYSEYDK